MVSAEKRYRKLLKILPKRFRQEAQRELLEVFRAEYAASRNAGGNALPSLIRSLRLWTRLLLDLLLTAVAVQSQMLLERLGARSRPSSSTWRQSTAMSRIFQDFRYALRALGRTPAFTAVAILTLALGIGANAAVFSVVHELFFKTPAHLHEPERLVRIVRTQRGEVRTSLSYPDFAHYRDHCEAFESLTGFDSSGLALTVGFGDEFFPAQGMMVSREYFQVLGARPQAGRWFLPEEGQTPGTHPVAVISHSLFQRLLGGRPEALPASLTLNGHPFTAVGAAPAGFAGASPLEPPPDLWVPLMMQPLLAPAGGDWTLQRVPHHSWNWLNVIGRLKDGVTAQAAQANLDAMAAYLAENYPDWNEEMGARLFESYRYIPGTHDSIVSLSRLMAAAVGLLLLIACVNIAVLLLARSSARTRDVGIRLALGAGRWRVLRLSLTESLLLALGGGLLGVLIADLASGLTRTLLPYPIPSFSGPGLTVLGASMALAAATALAAGLAPALQTSRLDPFSTLRGQQGLDSRGRLRQGLVVAQVALSLVLVCSAVLLARSLYAARSVDLGFESADRLLLQVNLRFHGYSPQQGRAFVDQVLERLNRHPAVKAATATVMVPFRGVWTEDVVPQDPRRQESPGNSGKLSADPMAPGTNAVAYRYFETMGIAVRGRSFTARDTPESPAVVIVNEAFAKHVWPDAEALGQSLYYERNEPPATVVGVARNARYYSLQGETQHQVYWPLSQRYQPSFSLLLHTGPLSAQLVQDLRRRVLEVDPSLALQQVSTLQEVVDNETAQYRTSAAAVTLFAVLALTLAAVGLYGVESYLVSQRRREIGVRMALGAGRGRIQRAVLFSAARQTALGLLLGLPAAILAALYLRTHLFGPPAHDFLTWLGVPLLLLAVALLAASLPAHRASRINPLTTLRAD
ncbi:MAG TPA: ABC transporter permease [Acidobacteriota bacterium]|nr:ABC transporter permease [Acidobacteriota bacterium]